MNFANHTVKYKPLGVKGESAVIYHVYDTTTSNYNAGNAVHFGHNS
jgi:hypothetical protein